MVAGRYQDRLPRGGDWVRALSQGSDCANLPDRGRRFQPGQADRHGYTGKRGYHPLLAVAAGTGDDAAETTPSWSSDGARIAFASNLFGGWDIHVIDIDGTDQKRLTTSAADDLLPAWSPDGSRIAFVSNRDGSSEIYVVRLDGSQPERLTTDSRVNEISGVSWSPDGLSIAFAATRDADTDIFVFSLRDGKESQITTASGADLWPSWGPTGRNR